MLLKEYYVGGGQGAIRAADKLSPPWWLNYSSLNTATTEGLLGRFLFINANYLQHVEGVLSIYN